MLLRAGSSAGSFDGEGRRAKAQRGVARGVRWLRHQSKKRPKIAAITTKRLATSVSFHSFVAESVRTTCNMTSRSPIHSSHR